MIFPVQMGKIPMRFFCMSGFPTYHRKSYGICLKRTDCIPRFFGSSLAPLLLGGYSKITLIDIRYIHLDYLKQYVDFTECDVLFLYSTLVLNNSDTFK